MLRVIVAGETKSGKSTLAATIEMLLKSFGMKVEVIDDDTPERRAFKAEYGNYILKDKEVAIETRQLRQGGPATVGIDVNTLKELAAFTDVVNFLEGCAEFLGAEVVTYKGKVPGKRFTDFVLLLRTLMQVPSRSLGPDDKLSTYLDEAAKK